MNIWKEKIITISPHKGNTPTEQLSDCLTTLRRILDSRGAGKQTVLRQTVFLEAFNNKDYCRRVEQLLPVMKDFFNSSLPPTSFVAQSPENQNEVALELILDDSPVGEIEIKRKTLEDIPYVVLNYKGIKKVYAAGLTAPTHMRCRDSHAGIFKLAQVSFQLMEKILQNENMTFADVVRQWNYIENILDRTQEQSGLSQNYQDFNEARAAFYKKADFVNGYPAATGIGMNTGGVIIDFIAIPGGIDVKIVPIKNPRQVDAHRYSREVLIGGPMTGHGQKASPKFERAKFVSLHGTPEIYISGTAAILGQKTAGQDVEEQTRITIENIRLLISDENLKNCGIELEPAQKTITYIRVYVKEEKDIPAVKRLCEDYYKDVPALYLVSDICRDQLSVEIEGIAKSQNSS